MQHAYRASYQDVSLRPLAESDTESLRHWRNAYDGPFLKQRSIGAEDQRAWFAGYLTDPEELLFSIDFLVGGETVLVGSIALSDCSKDPVELGKVLIGDTRYRGHHIGFKAGFIACWFAFSALGKEAVFATVHEDNAPSMGMFTKLGFLPFGARPFERGGQELELLVKRADFFALHAEKLPKIIR